MKEQIFIDYIYRYIHTPHTYERRIVEETYAIGFIDCYCMIHLHYFYIQTVQIIQYSFAWLVCYVDKLKKGCYILYIHIYIVLSKLFYHICIIYMIK